MYFGSWSPDGYGNFKADNATHMAHRWALKRVGVVVPEDMEVDHLCKTRCCVNLNHLEIVTPEENKRRAHADRTHCARGHPMAEDNIVWQHNGRSRRCKTCESQKKSEWKANNPHWVGEWQERRRSGLTRRRPEVPPAVNHGKIKRGHSITFNGETLGIPQWAERLGVDRHTIVNRLKNGWTEEDAVSKPSRKPWLTNNRSVAKPPDQKDA